MIYKLITSFPSKWSSVALQTPGHGRREKVFLKYSFIEYLVLGLSASLIKFVNSIPIMNNAPDVHLKSSVLPLALTGRTSQ
jgi:hypothetical protein